MRALYAARSRTPSDIYQHLPRLHAEASTGNAQVIELGVCAGNSTVAFLAAVERHGGHVWSVDIVKPDLPWDTHPQWTLIVGDDIAVADQLPNGVDVVFIDTSHHYTDTLLELSVYVPKVKPGGVVLLHDTELPRMKRRDPDWPVRTAIDKYCRQHGLTPEYVPNCYGLGVIRL